MKKLLLLVAVAISTVGFSQNVEAPNVEIKTRSYKTYQTVDYLTIDSTWYKYDSLTLLHSKCTAEVYSVSDTVTGDYTYNRKPVDKLVSFKKHKETLKFDFENLTLTRVSLSGRRVEHISNFFKVFGEETDEYYVYVVNNDGYERQYHINFTTHTVDCHVYLNPKMSIGLLHSGDRVYQVSKFSVEPKN